MPVVNGKRMSLEQWFVYRDAQRFQDHLNTLGDAWDEATYVMREFPGQYASKEDAFDAIVKRWGLAIEGRGK